MKISIVIPAYNEAAFIGDCLDSVLPHINPEKHEVIVVDNNSSDDTSVVASSRTGVRVVLEKRQGTSNARQTGAENAIGEIVAYLDADCKIDGTWLPKLEEIFSNPKVVFTSGPYRFTDSKRFPNWLLNSAFTVFVPVTYWIVGYIGNGGNCAVRKTALEQVGGNDRSITFYGDDTDLARRLHKVGKTPWRNDLYVYSSARRYDEQGFALYATYVKNFVWTTLFHKPYSSGLDLTTSQQHDTQK